jgi:hypothetical protein
MICSLPDKGYYSILKYISKCKKKSTSSLESKGYNAPILPILVPYKIISLLVLIKEVLRTEVPRSPTKKLAISYILLSAPFKYPVSHLNL